MDFQYDIQAISCKTIESGLCLFSYQKEWIFKKGKSQVFEIEYRHFGMIPFHQILVNRQIIYSSFQIGVGLNVTHFIENMKIQIKRYSKNTLNLLINGQDFENFISRLKTIAEIQEEPIENAPSISHRKWAQFKTFRSSENLSTNIMFSIKSSPKINFINFNVEKTFENAIDEDKINEEAVQLYSYLEGYGNTMFVWNDSFKEAFQKLNEKIYIIMNNCKNSKILQNLQNLKKKIHEISEENNINLYDLKLKNRDKKLTKSPILSDETKNHNRH